MQPQPFDPRATPDELDDLRRRVRSTRWPDAPVDAGWSLGADVDYLRELAAYWADEFDWPAQEEALARWPRFRAEVGGLGIHYVHARAVGVPDAMPIVLCHGWPDSSWRYTKVIDLLVDPGAHGGDPADAFDVVVPDMPGYGWSEAPLDEALNSLVVARLWGELMAGLGYSSYGAAGGDIGSHVSRYLALEHPDRVAAVHRTDGGMPFWDGDLSDLTPEEQEWFAAADAWRRDEGAYGAVHRTKPQTIAAGLNDSPVGLLAWIVEKLRAWSDCGGDVERSFTKDEILTLVTTYWLTGTIGSSMRMYAANAALPPAQLMRRVEVPSGFSLFPGDIITPPQAWLERTTDVVRVTHHEHGGHFGAFEEPEAYAAELREFFRPYR